MLRPALVMVLLRLIMQLEPKTWKVWRHGGLSRSVFELSQHCNLEVLDATLNRADCNLPELHAMSRDDLSSMLVSLLELPDEGRDERAVHAVACSHYVKCCKLRLDSQEISHKHRNRHEPATKKSFTINLPSTGLGGM